MYPYGKEENEDVYGLLYSEWLLDDESQICLCPEGWHLPDSSEWEVLKSAVTEKSGRNANIAAYLCDNIGWKKSSNLRAAGNLNTSHRNFTGFNARPAGTEDEVCNQQLPSSDFGRYAFFWCKGKSAYALSYESAILAYFSYETVHNSDMQTYMSYCSVRCVRD